MPLLGEQHVAFVVLDFVQSLTYQKAEYEPTAATHQLHVTGKALQLFNINFCCWKTDSNNYRAPLQGFCPGMYVKVRCKPYCTLLTKRIVTTRREGQGECN